MFKPYKVLNPYDMYQYMASQFCLIMLSLKTQSAAYAHSYSARMS
jgi:hypothetical protein